MRIVDWDIVYAISDDSDVHKYIKTRYKFPKQITVDELKAIESTLEPNQRFVDTFLFERGINNLIPPLRTVDGRGCFG